MMAISTTQYEQQGLDLQTSNDSEYIPLSDLALMISHFAKSCKAHLLFAALSPHSLSAYSRGQASGEVGKRSMDEWVGHSN